MSFFGQSNQSKFKSKLKSKSTARHPYLAGNFAPLTKTWPPTPVTWTGEIPKELHGGMYVRNGGNPVTNSDLGREAHWFDGDGMLSGVWFDRSSTDSRQSVVHFVNQFILTDVYLSAVENGGLHTPILPSISTLVNPVSSLFWILWKILRSILVVFLSHIPGSRYVIKRISVANTSVLFHDGRALATCESGPPIRFTLPELETVGWYNGNLAEGELSAQEEQTATRNQQPGFGGVGPLSWMREWTTGHPKVDSVTGDLILFHCTFAPPYVHYSLVPNSHTSVGEIGSTKQSLLNAPVPGCSGGKLMHDFGVSRLHTVILDLPLTLSPLNLAKNKPVLAYEPDKPARFGVFPRRNPESVRWFETQACCIFHTANTWDEQDSCGNVVAVNMLACRLTSASLIFSAGNITPPPHPDYETEEHNKPMSFFAKYDEDEQADDVEKLSVDEHSPLLTNDRSLTGAGSSTTPSGVPISYDEREQCRLYYYRFLLDHTRSNTISQQFALSAVPLEFPTVSPFTDMSYARYVYGCSTAVETFGAALGKATKIDVLVRLDVKTLLARAQSFALKAITGCVDERTIDQILASTDLKDPIKAFKLPPNHYAQEARFVPRQVEDRSKIGKPNLAEEDGYLLFYVFNEDQLDEAGECRANAKSELWVLDASTMQRIVCKIHLPTRIPYGLHGNWFTEEQIACQREVATTRSVPRSPVKNQNRWSRMRGQLIKHLG